MRVIDDRIETIVQRALHFSGVRDTDADAGMFWQFAIAQYFRITFEEQEISHDDLLDELTQAVILRRYRDLGIDDYLKMKTPVLHDEQDDLMEASLKAHLNHNERDVLYLLLVVGMTKEQIVEKFGAGSDWIEATIAKVDQMRRVDGQNNQELGGISDGNKDKS